LPFSRTGAGRRSDGIHLESSILQAISLADYYQIVIQQDKARFDGALAETTKSTSKVRYRPRSCANCKRRPSVEYKRNPIDQPTWPILQKETQPTQQTFHHRLGFNLFVSPSPCSTSRKPRNRKTREAVSLIDSILSYRTLRLRLYHRGRVPSCKRRSLVVFTAIARGETTGK